MAFQPDSDLRNSDWLKTLVWQVIVVRGDEVVLVESVDDLLLFLHVEALPLEQQRKAVRQFIQLPAAEPMPKALRRKLVDAGLLDTE